MLLHILTLLGDEYQFELEPTDKVLRIKQMLADKEGIPPVQQRLIYQGKKLRDEDTVEACNLIGGAVLHLVVALRGGE